MKMCRRNFVVPLLLCMSLGGFSWQANFAKVTAAEPLSNWPAFLGSGHNAATDGKLVKQWSPNDNIQWKVALQGHGQSSPVIYGDNVYVTTVDGGMKEHQIIYCLGLKDGVVRWKVQIENKHPVKNTFYTSRAAPTPVADKDGVYAFFESGQCVALTHSGEKRWEVDLAEQFGPFKAEFGLGASPCQNQESVFVLLEHAGPGALVALDKQSGQTRWNSVRPEGNSWSSPASFNIFGTEQVIVSSNGSVTGYDVVDGKELWKLDGLQGNTNVTPLDIGQGRFLIGASPARQQQGEDLSKKSNGLVQVVREEDGKWSAKLVWFNEKLSPSWGSPIAKDGVAYWVNRVGVLSGVDIETGEILYTERLKQSCWATPYPGNDAIYFFGKEGACTVIEPGRDFRIIHENQLFTLDQLPPETTVPEQEESEERRRAASNFSGPTVYGIAVSNSQIIARIGNQVFSIGEVGETTKATETK